MLSLRKATFCLFVSNPYRLINRLKPAAAFVSDFYLNFDFLQNHFRNFNFFVNLIYSKN